MAIQSQAPSPVTSGHGVAAPHMPETLGRLRRAVPPVLFLAACGALIAFGAYGTDLGLSAYSTYRVLVFIHVSIAFIALGSTFALPIIQPMAARQGIASLRFTMKFAEHLSSKVTGPGVFLVMASGVGLILTDLTGYRSSLPIWLIASMIWVGAANVLAIGVEGPTLRRTVEILDNTPDEGPPPEELVQLGARLRLVGQLLSFSTIGVLFLMAWRPDF